MKDILHMALLVWGGGMIWGAMAQIMGLNNISQQGVIILSIIGVLFISTGAYLVLKKLTSK